MTPRAFTIVAVIFMIQFLLVVAVMSNWKCPY